MHGQRDSLGDSSMSSVPDDGAADLEGSKHDGAIDENGNEMQNLPPQSSMKAQTSWDADVDFDHIAHADDDENALLERSESTGAESAAPEANFLPRRRTMKHFGRMGSPS